MSHEPECGYSTSAEWEGCICDILRAAYQRGRSSMGDDIRTAVAPFYNSPHGKYLAPLMSKIRTILINAGEH